MPGYNTEADYENAIIELFRNDLGYEYVYGPDVERDFNSPLYDSVLEESLYRLNKGLPADAINDALFKLRNFENGELVQKNAEFMEYLQSGIPVRYLEKGEERSGIVYLVGISLTIPIPKITPLSLPINGPSLRTVTSVRMLFSFSTACPLFLWS